jgi:sugar/nucleoside kinase (ribokinase family)
MERLDKQGKRADRLFASPASASRSTLPRRLVCIGHLSVDTLIAVDRPITLGDQTNGRFSQSLGGSAAITAHNAAVLGADVAFIGFAGGGIEDATALAHLGTSGVDVSGAQTGEGLRVAVLVEPGGERTMISNNVPSDWDSLFADISNNDVVYFEGWPLFDAVSRSSYVELLETAASAGAIVALDVCSASRGDPKRHRKLLADLPLDLLFANENEAAHYQLLDAVLDALVVVHRGPNPTAVVQHREMAEISHDPVDPVDSTGAGDTFAAGFLTAVSTGASLLGAVKSGHDAAHRVLNSVGPLLDPVSMDSARVEQEVV